jgi:AAA family ATP:ADP antiporter
MIREDRRTPSRGFLTATLQRVVEVRPEEVRVLLLSGAYFFFVLAAYYVIRPIREEMAVVSGAHSVAWLFSATLALTLLVHPLFTWLVSRYPRKQFIPMAYRFFVANLLLFFFVLRVAPEGSYVWIGRVFFSWTSVFNLFVVSVFWAFMADIFRSDQGKRLFGFVGIGGTLGAILGASVTAELAEVLGPVNLLLISAAFLEMAVLIVRILGQKVTLSGLGSRSQEEEVIGGGVLAGISAAFRSSYLAGIILFMFLFTFTSTAIYYQQVEIVGRNLTDPGAPTGFFARIDQFVNILALVTQAFLTGRIIRWFGLGAALAILPVVTIVGLLWIGLAPSLGVLFVVQVIRRGWNYGLMKPALEALYTVIPREEKYKAKNFIDTTIYRTGDQVAAWSNRGFMAVGMTFSAMAFLAAPLAGLWVIVALFLGRAQRRRAQVVEVGLDA